MTILPAHGNKWKITGGFVGSCGIYSLTPFHRGRCTSWLTMWPIQNTASMTRAYCPKGRLAYHSLTCSSAKLATFVGCSHGTSEIHDIPDSQTNNFLAKSWFLCSLPIHVTSATTTERCRERKKTHRERVRPKRGVD